MVMGVSDDQILAKADLTFMTRLLINRSVSRKDLTWAGMPRVDTKSRPDGGQKRPLRGTDKCLLQAVPL